MSDDAFADERVAKLDSGTGYQRGTITQHQEQAKLHRRKARKGGKVAEAGAGTAGAALIARPIARAAHPLGGRAANAAIVGGLATAAGGVGYGAFHTARANKEADAAQEARKVRNAQTPVVKSDRTRRGAEGAASVGSVGLAGGAVQQRRRAVKLAGASRDNRELAQRSSGVTSQRIMRHAVGTGKPGNLPTTKRELQSTHRSLELTNSFNAKGAQAAKDSFAAARKAKGRAGGAVLLGAGAVHLARKAPNRPTQSVGYR